jgi:hypothetical protein
MLGMDLSNATPGEVLGPVPSAATTSRGVRRVRVSSANPRALVARRPMLRDNLRQTLERQKLFEEILQELRRSTYVECAASERLRMTARERRRSDHDAAHRRHARRPAGHRPGGRVAAAATGSAVRPRAARLHRTRRHCRRGRGGDEFVPPSASGMPRRRGAAPPAASPALAIDEAIRMALAGEIDAIVTAPIDKAALHAGGFTTSPGHTEMLASRAGVADVVMLMAAERTAARRAAARGAGHDAHRAGHVPAH